MDALFDIPAEDGELFRPANLRYRPRGGESANGVGQRTLTYRDLEGQTQQGEVWSAGPLPGTAWVLPANRNPAVVDTGTYIQRSYTTPDATAGRHR